MKRTIAFILSVLMAFSVLPFVAFAEGECAHENYYWSYHGGDKTAYDCTKDTVYRDKICADCGETLLENSTILVQASHSFVLDKENSVEPTCSKGGENAYTCQYCTVTTKVEVDPLVHKWGAYSVKTLCFENGSDKHGEYIRYCELCGKDDTKTIVDHSYFAHEGKAATCYNAGLTNSNYCVQCGTLSNSVEIPKLEHIDKNKDTKCDYCDSPTVDNGAFCGCLCHSEVAFFQMLLPLVTLIWKFLGIDSCECGKAHY